MSHSDWTKSNLDSIAEFIGRGKSPEYTETSQIYVLNQACVQRDHLDLTKLKPVSRRFVDGLDDFRKAKHGDILINSTGTGTLGRVGFWDSDERIAFDSHITVMRPRKAFAPKFIYYSLCSYAAQSQINDNCITGSTNQTELSREAFRRVTLDHPRSYEHQTKIAEVLATLDRALSQTDALIAKYQRVKTGLMQDLLTRGMDENGNLRDPATHAFKESPLGQIPVEWEVTTLADIGQWVSGGTPSKSNISYWGGAIPWASPKDMKTLFLEDTIDHLTELGAKSGTRYLPTGSILVVVRGMVLINDFPVCQIQKPMTINQDVKGIITNLEFDSKFATYWLVSSKFKMMRLATEATHGTKRIDMKDLFAVCVPKPSLDEQKKIATILDVFQRDYAETRQRQRNLQRTKRGLMHDLLTGNVDISPLLDEDERQKGK